MTHLRGLMAIGCAFVLFGCGSGESDRDRQPPPVKDTVFGDMVGTMDKARGVQDTVDAQKEELDRQVKKQEEQSEP
ncbi:MAG: hypothetical protein ACJ8OJ_02050 [Povalibacter sp.]